MVELEISNYVNRALLRFKHIKNKYAQHSRHPFIPPQYVSRQQHEETISRVPLTPKNKKGVEEVIIISSIMHLQLIPRYYCPWDQ